MKIAFYFAVLISLFLSSCTSEPTLQKYFVENSDKKGFVTVDVSPSIINMDKTKLTAEQKRQKVEWTRLRNAVYITFPYAKAASKIMNEINAKLVGVTDRKQRKAIIKTREKELRKEFADRLTNLSIYQGKVLMKLIYRETGNNCYEIIQEYKGGFTAVLYQTIAVIVGTNLKQNYEVAGKDKDLEIIVKEVEKMYGYRG